MTAATSTRAGALAAVLTAVVLALALAFSAQADVRAQRARGAACTHSAAGHVEHSCTDSGRTGRSHGKGGRSHTHSKSGHHRKHPTKRPAGEGGEGGEGGEEAGESGEAGAGAGEHAASAGTSETLCEDGSAPKAEGGGVFVCEEASASSVTSTYIRGEISVARAAG